MTTATLFIIYTTVIPGVPECIIVRINNSEAVRKINQIADDDYRNIG